MVVGNAALLYTSTIADICAANKMPHVKDVRIIRNEVKAYNDYVEQVTNYDTLQKLMEKTKDFFKSTDLKRQQLYWTVRNEVLKSFPELNTGQADLYTNIYIAQSLFEYIRQFQHNAERRMSVVCGHTIRTAPDPHIKAIEAALKRIITGLDKGNRLTKTKLIEISLNVISAKIDQHKFSDLE